MMMKCEQADIEHECTIGPPYSRCNETKNYRKIQCIDDCMKKITSFLELNSSSIKSIKSECNEKCPTECNQVTFTSKRVDVQPRISPNMVADILKPKISDKFDTTEMSDEEIISRLSYLNIYFDKLETTKITQSPSMTVSRLIANVGGHLGKYVN